MIDFGCIQKGQIYYTDSNPEDEHELSTHDNSDLRNDNIIADNFENNEDLESEISIDEKNVTIDLPKDISINNSTSIDEKIEITEEGKEDYKELLKFESPSLILEKLLSQQDLDLSYIEETVTLDPPATQEDSEVPKEEKMGKSERVSRADLGNKLNMITRSKSLCGRYNDDPSVGPVNSSEQKIPKEKSCA